MGLNIFVSVLQLRTDRTPLLHLNFVSVPTRVIYNHRQIFCPAKAKLCYKIAAESCLIILFKKKFDFSFINIMFNTV